MSYLEILKRGLGAIIINIGYIADIPKKPIKVKFKNVFNDVKNEDTYFIVHNGSLYKLSIHLTSGMNRVLKNLVLEQFVRKNNNGDYGEIETQNVSQVVGYKEITRYILKSRDYHIDIGNVFGEDIAKDFPDIPTFK